MKLVNQNKKMHDQYPIDPLNPAEAQVAFAYLTHKDEAEGTDVFQGSEYFDPLPPIHDGPLTHYTFEINYEPNDEGVAAVRLMMADMEGDQPVGFGQVHALRNREGEIINSPFLVYTETEPDKRKLGYGRARLIALNSLTVERFGQALRSSDNIEPDAKSIWQGLLRDGLVEERGDRFRFKTGDTTSTD